MSVVESVHTEDAGLAATLGAGFRSYLEGVCRRTARALEVCGFDALLVHSGSLHSVFLDDRTYPFEVHAPFKVWTPLGDVPDCFVYFAPGQRPRLIFSRPTDYWHKAAELPDTWWSAAFDITPASDLGASRSLLPSNLARVAYIGDASAVEGWGVGDINPPRLIRHLDFDRAVKSDYELACLRLASRSGARGHLAVERAFEAGASEFEMELEFLRASGLREQELPYNPIIALNSSGAVLHYQVLEKRAPAQRHSLLIDSGSEFAGYASDITRTFSYRDPDFAALVQRMDRMQLALCDSVRTGVDWREVHLNAHYLIGEVLRDAGITNCSAQEAVDTGVTSVFFPHGIGHLLGLEVHDAGGFMRSPDGGDIPRPQGHPSLRLTRVLQKGFVVTMEPGLYFIDQLLETARADARAGRIDWRRVAALRPFGGIRIEDNLAITDAGCENLTRDAFRTVSLV